MELAFLSKFCVADEKSDRSARRAPGEGGKDMGVYMTSLGLEACFFLRLRDDDDNDDDDDGVLAAADNFRCLIGLVFGVVSSTSILSSSSSSSKSWLISMRRTVAWKGRRSTE